MLLDIWVGLRWKAADVSHGSTGNFNDCAKEQKETNATAMSQLKF